MVAPGTVVLVPFPFSDLSRSKFRPAIVLAHAGRGDSVLCQVTSNAYSDSSAIALTQADFASGGLRVDSFARPGKLFTANDRLIVKSVGTLRPESFDKVIRAVVSLLTS